MCTFLKIEIRYFSGVGLSGGHVSCQFRLLVLRNPLSLRALFQGN
jgi:hypothetical protein